MSGRYLLDSNIIIALFAGEKTILDAAQEADEIFIPAIVIGELFYGAENSSKRLANIARIEDFVEANVILDCDASTARWDGRIKQELKTKGRPIPENDIWIAALAFHYNLSVVTRDSHFNEISSLDVQVW